LNCSCMVKEDWERCSGGQTHYRRGRETGAKKK
jgi:hypothetical protein